MKKLLIVLALLLSTQGVVAQQHPGREPFVPTRIDWLITTLQASLRHDMTEENPFTLDITSPDSETILIYVRYMPNTNRERMNVIIDSARDVIKITVRSYRWENWVKVREDVQMARANAKQTQ